MNPPPGASAPLALRLEPIALLLLAFVLPLREGPKNLLWLAYAALWLYNRWRARDFGGRPDAWDAVIALWLASGYLATLAAGLLDGVWLWKVDLLRNASVLWMLMRSRLDAGQFRRLLLAIAAGTLVTLAWGYWGVYVTHERAMLGLRSVGHVNHSAIYLAIVSGALLIHARASWRSMSFAWRAASAVALAVCGVSLFIMQSRAAVGGAFIMAVILLGIHALRTRHGLAVVAAGALLSIAVVIAARPQVLEKHEEFAAQNLALSHRDGIWRIGIDAWRAHPWLGVGMDNFQRIDLATLERWRAARGEPFDATRYALSSHAHSLYVNTLAERGALGLAALLALLTAWLAALWRYLPAADAAPVAWSAWGGAASAWLIGVIVGTVNTTLHHEHAMLSMLFLGAWLSMRRGAART